MIYTGFSTLEEMLLSLQSNTIVNVLDVTSTQSGSHGLSRHSTQIILTACQADGEVLYCRIPVGFHETMYNEPIPHSKFTKESVAHRATTALEAITLYLEKKLVKWRHALIAFPKDLVLLDGKCEHMVYDKEKDKFYYRTASESKEAK